MEAGQSGLTGRNVPSRVEEELRVVTGPAITRHLSTGGRSVLEKMMNHVNAYSSLVSKNTFKDNL